MRSYGRLSGKIHANGRKILESNGVKLYALLPVEKVQQAVKDQKVQFRDCLFTPLVTLWTFLAQVLDPDGSCRAAVAKLLAFLAATDVAGDAKTSGVQQAEASSRTLDPSTGPYCKARKRLPEGLVSHLARDTGEQLHRRYPSSRLLGGRKVKVVDGTLVSMPDTKQNQKTWPQPPTQKPGLGFPLVRLVAVMSLNCAAILAVAFGPYSGAQTGETALLRDLLVSLEAGLESGDVLLADRYYASYWMIALLKARGIDSLFRQHQHRKIDFRRGQRLGKDDHLITIPRPRQRPEWMDQAAYEQLPEQMLLREVRVRVCQRGFRVRSLVLVTTLLDAALYSREELAKAFRLRWHVELDLRSIKQTMKMSVLRCKTPAMVRKEVWMRLLAYNLIRALMAEAAERQGIEPREISFAGAAQTINAFAPALQLAKEGDLPRLWEILLSSIARHRVGDRPDRYEPRAVKRRAKPIALLTVPRKEARKRLAKSGASKSKT